MQRKVQPVYWFIGALLPARLIASHLIHLYDDAFITFRYARNLAEGTGFVYNAGEWILGTTTPGFGLLLSLFYLIGLPMPESAILFNILCDAATLLLTFRYILDKTDEEYPAVASLFALFFIATPILARTSVGGMESSLFLLCSLGTIILFGRERFVPAAFLAGLCYFLRPEGVILIGLLPLILLFRKDVKRAFLMGGVSLGTVVPVLLLLYSVYGQIVSQSVLAKSTLEKASPFTVVGQLLSPDYAVVALAILGVAGIPIILKKRDTRFVVLLWTGLFLLAYAVGRPKVWSWYGVPVYYGAALTAATFLGYVAYKTEVLQKLFMRSWAPVGLALLGLLFWIGLYFYKGESEIRQYLYEPLEEWSRTEFSPDDTILAYDIGAIGYYSNAYIYDMAGLVTPDALKTLKPGRAIRKIHPDYLYMIAAQGDISDIYTDPSIAERYRPAITFFADPDRRYTDDTLQLPDHWVQEYIIFKRLDNDTTGTANDMRR